MSRQGMVAILGRPNVGKSSFFNYVTGKRISIVEDVPGVTRDRIYEEVEWSGRRFTLADTGGLEPNTSDTIFRQMKRQAELAIELADVILFMVDLKDGVTADDMDIATLLRKTQKPVLLVVNKVDQVGAPPPEIYEFYHLGLGDFYAVSSAHGLGIGEVLDAILAYLPEPGDAEEEGSCIKAAVVGKPNAGNLPSLIKYWARSVSLSATFLERRETPSIPGLPRTDRIFASLIRPVCGSAEK